MKPVSTTEQARQRGPRRSAATIHQLLIDAGLAIVERDGLASGAEHLTFKRVFAYLEARGVKLTHASVIRRVFDSQEDYQAAVLRVIAESDSANLVYVGDQVIEQVIANADLSSPTSRFRCFEEICRVGGNEAADLLHRSPMWRAWIGVWALAASGTSATDHELRATMAENYRRIDADARCRYDSGMAFLGIRPKAPFTVDQFSRAISSLLEGCSLRGLVDPEAMAPVELPTGPDGALQTWTPQSVAFVNLGRAMFEIDPDWVPPTA